MSTELTVGNETGKSLTELMGLSGVPNEGKTQTSIARIGMVHTPIMGEVEYNGKSIKTEIVPTGSFIFTKDDERVYSEGVSIRLFAQRNQWQRWNSDTEEMEKSVQSNTLNGDLKDSIGGINLGRPSGYIEDFQSLPEDTKKVIRSVKRVTVYYGTITLDSPMDEAGQPVQGEFVDVPFIMDVKNRESLKSINTVLNTLKKKNLLPIMSTIKLSGIADKIPTGAAFGKIEAKLGDKVDIVEADNDMLKNFLELIEYSNAKILDMYYERSKEHTDQDEGLVQDILNNDFVEVDE